MTKRRDRTYASGDELRCPLCGRAQRLSFPIELGVFAAAGKAFAKSHRSCEQTEEGLARFRYKTPAEWARSWDVGISSGVIYSVLSGQPTPSVEFSGPGETNWPHDVGDFGRCVRLVRVGSAVDGPAPSWAERLGEVSGRYPCWAPFVVEWSKLSALYTEETGCAGWELPKEGTKAPRLYEAVRRCAELAEVCREARRKEARAISDVARHPLPGAP